MLIKLHVKTQTHAIRKAGSRVFRIERNNDNEDDSSTLCDSVASIVCNSKDNLSRQFSNTITHNRSRFNNPPMQSSRMSEYDECDDDHANYILEINEQNKKLINIKISSTTSSATMSGLSSESNNKVSYPMHYHMIIIGSPNYVFNNFGSKIYQFLDR